MIEKFNGLDCVSSLTIAKEFGKRHDNILGDIEQIVAELNNIVSNDVVSYFIESNYLDKYKRIQKECLLTKKGLFLYLFGNNIELTLHILESLDISNIFESLSNYVPKKEVASCYLYLIQSGNSNVYKIGITNDVNARIRNITHHDKLELVRCWEFKSKSDCRKMEGKVHKALHERRANREWFYLEVDSGASAEIVDNLIKS